MNTQQFELRVRSSVDQRNNIRWSHRMSKRQTQERFNEEIISQLIDRTLSQLTTDSQTRLSYRAKPLKG